MRLSLLLTGLLLKVRLCAIWLLLIFQTSVITNASAEKISVVKMQSNLVEIGYQIGDIAHQTVIVQTPKGYSLDAASLPALGKSAAYMELRDVKWQTQTVGNMAQHTLAFDWQIFRVMQEIRAYSLKPLDLKFRGKNASDHVLTVHVNAAKVMVASVLPTLMDAAHTQPLADAVPALRNTRPMFIILCLSIIGLLCSSLYFAWRFDWLPAKLTAYFAAPRPFKRAYREIKSLQKTGDATDQITDAMRRLRQACDATAGATLSTERVAILFERNAKLLPKRTEIEHFYAESERSFFAGTESGFNLKQLVQLSHQLMVLESV